MTSRISWLDVKLGVRMMVKHPAITLVGGLGLAVGIAISVGFYSFSMAHIYPALPLDDGERVVALENRDVTIDNEERRSLHDFFTWREELESVEDLAAFRTVERNLIVGDEPPELVKVAEMTAAGFRIARVAPLHGRHLVPEDEREGAPPVLVIGYDVWRNRFGGDSGVVGRTVRLGGVAHTVIGVMPEGFAFPESHRFWTPLRADPLAYERRAGPPVFIAGRLAPGFTMEDAQAELSAIGLRTAAAFPETHRYLRPMVMPYTHSLSDVQGITAWQVIQMNLMMSLVLIVIALNVAVLVYARTAARQGEIAMRNALGASRGRIVSQLFVEAFVLTVGASALGLALARVGIGMGHRIMGAEYEVGVPFWLDYSLRLDAVAFAVGVAAFVSVITGVVPALQATGRRLAFDLRQLGGAGMRLGRTWTVLIVAQVAIAVAALPVAVNMGWTEMRGAATRPIYPADEFVAASLVPESARPSAPSPDTESPAESAAFGLRLAELLRRLDAEPAVAGATFLTGGPGRGEPVQVEGMGPPAEHPAGWSVVSVGVALDLPQVFGARVLSGRSLEPGDLGQGAPAVIVTQAFVRQVLGGVDAVGTRIRYVGADERAGSAVTVPPPRWYEIVGVVEDLATNTVAPELITPAVYHPVDPNDAARAGGASLRVRLRGSTPAAFAPRFRELTAQVDPALRLGTVRSLADSDRQRQAAARLAGLAVGLVLLSVLLLSAAGIYAMMSFTVMRRRREIGIRSALGAQPRQLLRSVFARAASQIALGLAAGIAVAAVLEWLTEGALVEGRGPVLLPAIAILVAIVGMLATLGPARRGLRIQPTEALREER